MGITDKVKTALSSNNNNQRHSDGTSYSAPSGTHVYSTDPNDPYNSNGTNYTSPVVSNQTYNPSTQSHDNHATSGHHSHGLSAPFSHHSHNQTTTSQTWNPVTQSYDTHTTTPAKGHHPATSSTYNPVTQSTTTQQFNPASQTYDQHTTTSGLGHNNNSTLHTNTPALGHNNNSTLHNEPVATPAAIEPQHSILGNNNLNPNTYTGPTTAPTPQNTMVKPVVAHNQYGEPVLGTSDRRPIHPDPPVHERNAMDPADTRHGSNVMTSTGAAGNPSTSHVAETSLHNDYNDHHHRHHDDNNTLGHDPQVLAYRNKDPVHDPYKTKEDTNIREQAREYRHENALKQANTTISASNVPQAIIPTTDQTGHKMPDFRGAKIVHKCDHCGVDNDISRYFRQEAVYRLS